MTRFSFTFFDAFCFVYGATTFGIDTHHPIYGCVCTESGGIVGLPASVFHLF